MYFPVPTGAQIDDWENQVGEWEDSPRSRIAAEGLRYIRLSDQEEGYPSAIAIEHEGELKAIAAVAVEKGDTLYLGFAATKEPGHGRALMRGCAKTAAENGCGMWWMATPDPGGSTSFYTHIGFKANPPGSDVFDLTAREVQEWLES